MLAYRFDGTRFDCGSKAGIVKATLHMALRDPALAEVVRGFAEERPAAGS
jgi:UTP--glucose-1-phosphate uridylyltransferase